jgi:hypothetical protein
MLLFWKNHTNPRSAEHQAKLKETEAKVEDVKTTVHHSVDKAKKNAKQLEDLARRNHFMLQLYRVTGGRNGS